MGQGFRVILFLTGLVFASLAVIAFSVTVTRREFFVTQDRTVFEAGMFDFDWSPHIGGETFLGVAQWGPNGEAWGRYGPCMFFRWPRLHPSSSEVLFYWNEHRFSVPTRLDVVCGALAAGLFFVSVRGRARGPLAQTQ